MELSSPGTGDLLSIQAERPGCRESGTLFNSLTRETAAGDLELCVPSFWDVPSHPGNTEVSVLGSAIRLLTITMVSGLPPLRDSTPQLPPSSLPCFQALTLIFCVIYSVDDSSIENLLDLLIFLLSLCVFFSIFHIPFSIFLTLFY